MHGGPQRFLAGKNLFARRPERRRPDLQYDIHTTNDKMKLCVEVVCHCCGTERNKIPFPCCGKILVKVSALIAPTLALSLKRGGRGEVAQALALKHLQRITSNNPDVYKYRDRYGYIPLHRAAKYGCSIEALQMLIGCFPEARDTFDASNCNPLHHALSRRSGYSSASDDSELSSL